MLTGKTNIAAKTKRLKALLMLLCSALLVATFIQFALSPNTNAAQLQTVPYKLNFQARLTDQNGNILTNGSYNIKFRLFSNSAGTGSALWEEDYLDANSQGATVTNGIFSVQLGSITALTPQFFASNPNLWLQIELPSPSTATTNSPSWTEGPMSPLQPLASAPYAMNADTIDGIDSTQLARTDVGNTFTGNNTFSNNLTVQGSTSLAGLTATTGSFSSTLAVTGATSLGSNLTVTGAPTASATSSLIQIGNAIVGGNSVANGGTYIGLNAPSSGPGSAADFLNFQVNGASELQVTNTGNLTAAGSLVMQGTGSSSFAGKVGIGTATPSTLLDVETTAVNTQVARFVTGGGGTDVSIGDGASRNIDIGHNGSDLSIIATNAGAGGFTITGASSALNLTTDSNTNAITLQSGTGTGNIILNGNIGVGTTSPAYKLDVEWQSSDTGSSLGYFNAQPATGSVNALTAFANSGFGLYSQSTSGAGVGGISSTSYGVIGASGSSYGVYGKSNTGSSGYFQASSTSNTAPTLLVQQNSTNTANLLQLQNSSGTPLSGFNANGQLYYKSGSYTVTLTTAAQANNVTLTIPADTHTTDTICLQTLNNCSSGSGVNTVGTFSASSQSNGATISGNTITFGPADTTNPGMVTASGTQTFGGTKFFDGQLIAAATGGAALSVGAPPTASATTSLVAIGNPIQGGSASGTYLGLNAASGYAGDLLNLQVNGTSELKVDASGNITNAGSLTTSGNASVGGTLGVTGTASVGGNLTVSGTTTTSGFINNGTTFFKTLSLGNIASSGDIGTAATTVDLYSSINISQTTPGNILTLPAPTNSTPGSVVFINNTGSTDFYFYDTDVVPGASREVIWNGSNWALTGGSVNSYETAFTAANQTHATTTPTADSYLTFASGNNQTWMVVYTLQFVGSVSSNNFQAYINGPSGSTCTFSMTETSSGNYATSASQACGSGASASLAMSANSGGDVLVLNAEVSATNGGNFTLYWGSTQGGVGHAYTMRSSSTLVAYRLTGADLAEVYHSTHGPIQPGSLVALDGTGASQVRETNSAYDQGVIGIVSTNPDKVIGAADGSGVPVIVGLDGRVPVRVNNQNGPIQPGDYLVPSSTPGVAMKATGPGMSVGQAMTGWSGSGEGMITAFIKNTYYPGAGNAGTLQQSGGDLQAGSQSAGSLITSDNTTSGLLSSAGTSNGSIQAQSSASSPTVLNDVSADSLSVKNGVNIGGDLTVAGSVSAASLTTQRLTTSSLSVTGTAYIASLEVVNSARFDSDLTVAGKTQLADLFVGGQLVLAGHFASEASIPGITLSSQLGPGVASDCPTNPNGQPLAICSSQLASSQLAGTDIAGTITLKAGYKSVSGVLATVNFNKPYSDMPRIVLSPDDQNALGLGLFIQKLINASGQITGFQLVSASAPTTGQSYSYDYVIIASSGIAVNTASSSQQAAVEIQP